VTQWSPIWKIIVNGTEVTDSVLANLTINSGRTNVYEQAQAGYCNLQIINFNQEAVNYNVGDSVTVELKDSTSTFVAIFGGSIVDLSVTVSDVGNISYTQTIGIIALGALSRLPKALTDGVLPKEFDGDQMYDILSQALFITWQQVPSALQWNTYDPTETWATAGNNGLGEIDRPGAYELAARTSSRTDIYSLAVAIATSGFGYLYEQANGQIGYADAQHRSVYLNANGYVDLSANQALANGINIVTRTGDIRNSVTVKYGASSSAEESAEDTDSIAIYGQLAQIVTTTLHDSADATAQANFYLELRAYPQAMFNRITYELTNPEVDDADRDALISIFMGMPVRIADLPLNMSASQYLGFVEGWTIQAGYNQCSITPLMSPLAFSIQSLQWQSVNPAEQWNTISPTLDWEHATTTVA
jgi:hypothetical protein